MRWFREQGRAYGSGVAKFVSRLTAEPDSHAKKSKTAVGARAGRGRKRRPCRITGERAEHFSEAEGRRARRGFPAHQYPASTPQARSCKWGAGDPPVCRGLPLPLVLMMSLPAQARNAYQLPSKLSMRRPISSRIVWSRSSTRFVWARSCSNSSSWLLSRSK